ncbi:MAG: hypothetical protein WCD49_09290 [Candidatus Acidiferrales bacterium]
MAIILEARVAGATEMIRSRALSQKLSTRISLRSGVPILCLALGLFATVLNAPANSGHKKENKKSELHWNPPQVDAPLTSISATPPCQIANVLKQAGDRAEELITHLQNFDAQEQLRYEQTDDLGVPEMSTSARFDYLVDFGEKSDTPKVHETRVLLSGAENVDLGSILDRGLPALALIFNPSLQGDYDMRCEGLTVWNDQPAWVVYFRQSKDKRPRTFGVRTASQVVPVRLKGRAWIATASGQVMHLETNLVDGVPRIGMRGNAVSVDYAPVKFHSQDVEMWLPQSAIAYIDYGNRRTIVMHTFSDFRLFSVQTQQVIEKPKSP